MIKKCIDNLVKGQKNDTLEEENYLSMHYNEMLQYQDAIQNIQLCHHYRIFQQVIESGIQDKINYDLLVSFIVNQLDNNNRDINVLLTLIDPLMLTKNNYLKLLKCRNVDHSLLKIPVICLFDIHESVEKMHQQYFNLIKTNISDFKNDIQQNLHDEINC